MACCGPRLGLAPVLLSPRATRVFRPQNWGPHCLFGCLAAGQSASAHQVEHEPNHTGVVLLKQADGVLPDAPLFGPSPARQGSAAPLRALDRLLPPQEPGLYRRGRPNRVGRPQEPNELCCYFK